MTTLGDCVDLVLFAGAARVEATPAQRVRLRDEITPMLDAYRAGRIEERDIKARIEEIMGPAWAPTLQGRSA